MLTTRLLNGSALSSGWFRAAEDGTGASDTPPGGAAGASAVPPAGAESGSAAAQPQTPAAGADTVAAGEAPAVPPPAPDWRDRRIQELSGMNGKLKQRQAELEQQMAAAAAKASPVGTVSGRNYTPQEFEAAVTEQARNLSAVEIFDRKCNETGREGMAKYTDFQQKLDTLKAAAPLDPSFLEQAWEMGNAHDIIYELGKDPAKGMEIMNMRPTQRAVALAKLTSEVAARPKPLPVSKAPPPNAAAVGATTGGAAPLENIQSMDEWMKERERQLGERKTVGGRRR